MRLDPLVWLLLADKQGDNRQAQVIADLLDIPYEVRTVLPLPRYVKGKPRVRPTIAHLDLARSDSLVAPWPDILITVGRRPNSAALWVQQQSGGKTQLILIGRQPPDLGRYALVISSCQYITADDPRIIRIALPLDDDQPPASTQPDGFTTLLVGGPTRTFRMHPNDIDTMLTLAKQADARNPLRVVTSRRTPKAVLDRLRTRADGGFELIEWQTKPGSDTPKYTDILARSSRFIVTGDSISMVCDAVRTARPVAIFILPYRYRIAEKWHQLMLAVAGLADGKPAGATARLLRWCADKRLFRLPRNFEAFFQYLFDHHCASNASQGFLEHYQPIRTQDYAAIQQRLQQIIEFARDQSRPRSSK